MIRIHLNFSNLGLILRDRLQDRILLVRASYSRCDKEEIVLFLDLTLQTHQELFNYIELLCRRNLLAFEMHAYPPQAEEEEVEEEEEDDDDEEGGQGVIETGLAETVVGAVIRMFRAFTGFH